MSIPKVDTGYTTEDGEIIYEDDIVVAKDKVTPPGGRVDDIIVDRVHWADGAWVLGKFEGTLGNFLIIKKEGNALEKPWPINL